MAAGKPVGNLFVRIGAKTKDFVVGLRKSAAETKKFSLTTQRSIKGVSVAFAAVGVAAVYGISKAVTAASDLEEVTSKFNTVFEGQEKQAEQWSRTLVDSYAMSTREAKQYLSGVQDLLVPMGMQSKAAGEMSSKIVSLAADLGSFNNLQTADVIRDMESALTGEYQTMKKYGIVLNATTIQQRALEMGLADTKKELTAAMKAEAAYAMMVDGSAAAIGDMDRTSESYANQVKKLKARVEDLVVAIGTELLPVAKGTVKVLGDLVGASKLTTSWFSDMSKGFGLASAGVISWRQALKDGAVWAKKFSEDSPTTRLEAEAERLKKGMAGLELQIKSTWSRKGSKKQIEALEEYKAKIKEVQDQIEKRELTIKTQGISDAKAAKAKQAAQDIATAQAEAEQKAADAIKRENERIRAIRTKSMSEFKTSAGEGYEFQKSLLDKRKEDYLKAFAGEKDAAATVTRMMADDYQKLEDSKVAASGFTGEETKRLQEKYADEYMETKLGEYEYGKMMLDQRKAEMIAAGYEEKLVIDSLAEKYKELHEQKVLDSGTFFEGMSVGLSQLYDETMTYAELGAQTTKTLFTGVTKGIGKSVAQAVMSGKSMGKSMEAVMKNVAASIIESLVTVGIQRMLLKVLNLEATATEHVASSAAAAAETYGNSFKSAAAIPVVGWAMAPGVAAANLAAVLSGMAAAAKAGAGVAAIGHGGIENVPKESTYFLDEGERVLSPNQNTDLMDFMGSGGGQAAVFNIYALDTQSMEEAVRDRVIPILENAMEVNYGGYNDSLTDAVAE